LLDYWPLRRTRTVPFLRLMLEKIPLFALSLAFSAFVCYAHRTHMPALEILPVSYRVRNALVAYTSYLGMTLWPRGLMVFYPHPFGNLSQAAAARAGALLLAMTAAAVYWGRRCPYLFVGWLWYLVTLLPVIGLVQVGSQSMADRYTYVPLIG